MSPASLLGAVALALVAILVCWPPARRLVLAALDASPWSRRTWSR